MSPALLEILRCPETQQRLALAPSAMLTNLNGQIRQGQVTNRSGEPVRELLENGLLRQDGTLLYPVRQDLPVLLIEEAIPL